MERHGLKVVKFTAFLQHPHGTKAQNRCPPVWDGKWPCQLLDTSAIIIIPALAHTHASGVDPSSRPTPLRYFTYVPITTPVISALKNYSIISMELSRSFNRNFKQLMGPGAGFYAAVSEVKQPPSIITVC
jgi:hypothetical protein